MQDRYVGDVGDYAKYSFLNALSEGQRLGIACYLFPDESHNADGKHIGYLSQPNLWRHVAPDLFDALKNIVDLNQRSTRFVEQSEIFPRPTKFTSECLHFDGQNFERASWRSNWFSRTEKALDDCEIVFADPDNGFCLDEDFKPGKRLSWKRLPVAEVHTLSAGRTAVFYHHNTRRAGGHDLENEYWLDQLGLDSFAVKASVGSARSFFVVNTKKEHREAATAWMELFNRQVKGKPKATAFRL